MPNVNIPETDKMKLAWTHQEKKRRQSLKKMMDMVVPGKEEKKRAA